MDIFKEILLGNLGIADNHTEGFLFYFKKLKLKIIKLLVLKFNIIKLMIKIIVITIADQKKNKIIISNEVEKNKI